ncbi:MAG: O-antigen ligase family protein [Sulfurimonadaceae bacterium]|jgi:O-antigen ligase|nr:O-antigen ligase family protein [Sulfurimonadaceae bacterium]
MTSINNCISKINLFQDKNKNNINLLLNHLTVVFLFFTPITFSFPDSRTVSFLFTLLYILIVIRGNYLKYLKISLSHPLTKPYLYFMSIHFIWMIGTSENTDINLWLKYSYHNLYPLLFFSFLDKRFFNIYISSFILGAFFSEVLSYLMNFNLIPWKATIDISIDMFSHYKTKILYEAVKGEPTPFMDRSYYSALLAIVGSLILIRLFDFRNNKIKILIYTLFFTSITINLFFIGGRAGYLLYIILLMYILYHFYKKYSNRFYTYLILGILSISTIVSIAMYNSDGIFKHRVQVTLDGIYSTINGDIEAEPRVKLLIQGIKATKDNFLFGQGTGEALSHLRNKEENKNTEIQIVRDVHNQYIDLILQFGLIGLLIYLHLIYKIFKFNDIRITENQYLVKNIMLISIIYLGCVATFSIYFTHLLTLLVIISTINKEILDRSPIINKKTIIIYCLFIIISYIVGILQ